jgi:hypothetical protein
MTGILSVLKGLSEPLLVAIIALAGVLISAIISALIAFVTSRKALYVNAVTVERSKWIEKLRNNLAMYSGLAHSVFFKAKLEDWAEGGKSSPEYYALIRQLQDLRSLLKLQLNPKGKIDQNIIILIDQIYDLSRTWTFGPQLAEGERLLVLHSQFLLKAEWEKVKSEARGPWRAISSKYSERQAARGYQLFASNEGAIHPIRIV